MLDKQQRIAATHAAYTVLWLTALTREDMRAELRAYYAARRAAKCERYKIAKACADGMLKPESALRLLNEVTYK